MPDDPVLPPQRHTTPARLDARLAGGTERVLILGLMTLLLTLYTTLWTFTDLESFSAPRLGELASIFTREGRLFAVYCLVGYWFNVVIVECESRAYPVDC